MMNEQRFQEAIRLHTAGNLAAAWDLYTELDAAQPNDPGLTHLRGVLAGQVGNLLESVRLIELAITLLPTAPDFYKNLAVTYHRLEDFIRAANTFSKLGGVLTEQGQLHEAIEPFADAARLQPQDELHANNLGAALNRVGRYAEARAVLDQALSPAPNMPLSLRHWRGKELGENYTRQLPALHLNLGNALHGLGDIAGAVAAYRRVLTLKPDSVLGHYDLGLVLLLQGQYREGWAEFEWRWAQDNYLPHRYFSQPIWQGESAAALAGPLLVTSEQGYGDMIQFARFLPILADQGHEILFEVKPELLTLFTDGLRHARLRVIPKQEDPTVIYQNQPFAAHIGLMSVPRLLNIELKNIPATVPYLGVDTARQRRWAARLGPDRGHKVGLVWGGNPLHPRNFLRSMPPEHWEPLLRQPGTSFYSLQKGPAAQYRFSAGTKVAALDAELTDFAETAAAIEQLDLVIGVDTAVIHLAAALGKPAWVIVPPVADWRWGISGETTPWYPTVRIFRMRENGGWNGVIAEIKEALNGST